MAATLKQSPNQKDQSWFVRHRVWAWILVWIVLLLTIRIIGWGIGEACDGAMNCIL